VPPGRRPPVWVRRRSSGLRPRAGEPDRYHRLAQPFAMRDVADPDLADVRACFGYQQTRAHGRLPSNVIVNLVGLKINLKLL